MGLLQFEIHWNFNKAEGKTKYNMRIWISNEENKDDQDSFVFTMTTFTNEIDKYNRNYSIVKL